MQITTAELLDALAASAATRDDEDIPPDTYSAHEVRAAMRWGWTTWHRVISRMLADGTAEVVTVRKRGLDGRLCTTKAYTFHVEATPKRRKAA